MGFLDELDLPQCGRSAFAGVFIGTTCGFMFGTIEAAKQTGLTNNFAEVGKKMRDPALMRFFFRAQIQTTAMFGASFLLYQTTCCMLESNDVEKYPAIGAASVVSLGPFLPSRLFRRNLPWAAGLIAMDIYSGGIRRD